MPRPPDRQRPGHIDRGTRTPTKTSDAIVRQFQRRVLVDALAEGMRQTWQRRAAMFKWARPRRGDYPGRATAAELAARDKELAELAAACRLHADLMAEHVLDVADLVEEVS